MLQFIFLSCKKQSGADVKISTRLIAIQDSASIVNFTYTSDKITNAEFSILGSTLKIDYANFEYTGDNDIKVSSPNSDLNIEFILNDSKLPMRMTRHETGSEIGRAHV